MISPLFVNPPAWRVVTRMTAAACCFAALWGYARGAHAGKMSVLNSPHNLSASGLGKTATYGELSKEDRVCVFCHVPHNAVKNTSLWDRDLPIWSRNLSPDSNYLNKMYQSPSLKASVSAAPTGASRLCLSCHDGTIALGQFKGSLVSSPATTISGSANLTTDLSNDHPISFEYSAALAQQSELASPETLPEQIKLTDGYLQCTSCHDAHDNEYGKFLVMKNGSDSSDSASYAPGSPLCTSCHKNNGWSSASHNPIYNVLKSPTLDAGCQLCHTPHNAPVAKRLLKDDTCYLSCHNGSPTDLTESLDVKTSFQQPYRHDIAAYTGTNGGIHGESSELSFSSFPRHVVCADCHAPHAANETNRPLSYLNAPYVNGPLTGVKISSAATAAKEYEICYRCHAGTNPGSFIDSQTRRVVTQPDENIRFNQTSLSGSYHPVMTARRSDGSSLLTALQSSMTMIYCSDCHNSDQSSKALGSGTGANGPHGSKYEHILMAQYDMPIPALAGPPYSAGSYSAAKYDLCYRCHNESYILGTSSGFSNMTSNEHVRHVVNRMIACFVCHDPHGIAGNYHLINFSTDYVSAAAPVPSYTTPDPTSKTGQCMVSCHSSDSGYTHGYSPTGAAQKSLLRKW
ncbi:cytochrome c [Geobacter sp. AOG2]|nr:cytochrome c [Geobacter sp. AOG2]